jgi:hypothetical protein
MQALCAARKENVPMSGFTPNIPPADGKMREARYRCDDCERGFVRITDQKLVLPQSCPFCGGRCRLTREPEELE